MTDYLALLLEPLQEDENEPFVWRRISAVSRNTAAEEERRNRNMAERTAVGTDEYEESGWRQPGAVRTWRERVADPTERLAALKRAEARLNHERVAAGMRQARVEQARAVTEGMASAAIGALPGVQRGLAGLLDAAIERDARRYDGPLGLF